jgi:hypothetical protein
MALEAKKFSHQSFQTSGSDAGSAKMAIFPHPNLNLRCGSGSHPVLEVCEPDRRQSTLDDVQQFPPVIFSPGKSFHYWSAIHKMHQTSMPRTLCAIRTLSDEVLCSKLGE